MTADDMAAAPGAQSTFDSTNDEDQEENCCNSCKLRCKRFYDWILPILDYQNIVTQWLAVIDIVTDILAIIQYFKNDNIPDFFAWMLIVVLYLSFRYQTLWIIGLYFDQQTSDDGLFGTITIPKAILTYIPFIGCTIAFCGELTTVMLVIADCIGSIFFFIGPILVLFLSFHCWLIWIKYLFCSGPKPTEKTIAQIRTSGQVYQRMSITDIGVFIGTWESIMESFPQTIIGSYVTFKYLNDTAIFNTDTAIIVISLIISAFKLLHTVIKLVLAGGHKVGEIILPEEEHLVPKHSHDGV